jgi:uncharacterized membrane protein
MPASDSGGAEAIPESESQAITAKRPAVSRPAAIDNRSGKSQTEPTIATPPVTWRVWLARVLDRYPRLDAPLEGRGARVAFWFVVACAVAYTAYITVYLFATQTAWQTNAEDMGIMAQALWNTTHGAPLHQTICNIVSDTNCIGDVSRFAIHFEPIMLPVALLYAIIPDPRTLQFLQAAVVASGALPAYWLASRRLRSALAGVAFALLYLFYPPLQAAVAYDFHAVTLAAAFLMYALYFMMTRNNWGLFITCLLALSTKEQIPVDVLMIAASVALFQRRWRTGGALAGMALVWLVVALVIMRAASPLGHSPTAARYAQFGSSPLQVAVTLLTHPAMVIRQYVLSAGGVFYLRQLLSGVGYLAALSPWSLAMAGPAMAINLLSSDVSMRSGGYQYNADIAPFVIFATLDAVWWLSRASAWLTPRIGAAVASAGGALATWGGRAARAPWPRLIMTALTLYATVFGAYSAREHGHTPLTPGIVWPQSTAHSQLANQLIKLIPPDASVCAQTDLVPHISNRRFIYLYPYQMTSADYIFLDVTGSVYPLTSRDVYAQQVQGLLRDTDYHTVAATDGYLLLERGAGPALDPSDPYGLPSSFYTFVTHAATPSHALNARFGSQFELVGYDITPSATIYPNNQFMQVVTYWRVTAPLDGPAYPQIDLTGPNGVTVSAANFPANEWLPMADWKPGEVYQVDSAPIYVASAAGGLNTVSVRVFAGARGDPEAKPLTATINAQQSGLPALTDNGTGVTFANETVHS